MHAVSGAACAGPGRRPRRRSRAQGCAGQGEAERGAVMRVLPRCPRFVQASARSGQRMSSVCPRLCVRWPHVHGRPRRRAHRHPARHAAQVGAALPRGQPRTAATATTGSTTSGAPAAGRDARPRRRRVVPGAGGGPGARRRRRRLGAATRGGRRHRRRRRSRAGRRGDGPGRPQPGARPRLLVRRPHRRDRRLAAPGPRAARSSPGATGESAWRASTSPAPGCSGGSPRPSTPFADPLRRAPHVVVGLAGRLAPRARRAGLRRRCSASAGCG